MLDDTLHSCFLHLLLNKLHNYLMISSTSYSLILPHDKLFSITLTYSSSPTTTTFSFNLSYYHQITKTITSLMILTYLTNKPSDLYSFYFNNLYNFDDLINSYDMTIYRCYFFIYSLLFLNKIWLWSGLNRLFYCLNMLCYCMYFLPMVIRLFENGSLLFDEFWNTLLIE